jgi:hypothetical protein
MSTHERVLIHIVILVAVGAIILLRGGKLSRLLIVLSVAGVVGIIWGIYSVMASSPNAPAWTQYSWAVGALSGVAFVLLFVFLRYRKR